MCSAGPNQDRDDIPSQSHHDNTSGSGSSSGPRSDNGDRSPYLEGTRTPITVPVNRPSGPINEESAADSPVRDHHQSKSAVERVSTVSSPRASSTSDLRSTPTYVGAGDGSAEYEELGDESSHNDDDDGDDPFADLRGSSGLQDELSELDDDEEEYGSEDDDYDDPSVDPNILQTAIDNSDVDEYTSMEQMRSKLENAKLRAQRYRQTMHGRDMASSQVIGKLKKEIRQLKEKNQSLLRRLEGRAEEVIPWIERLEKLFLNGEDNVDENGEDWDWDAIYDESCRQGNMSRNPYTVHPDLRWSAASFTEEVSREIHEEGLRAGRRVLQPFHFDKLPISIQQRIFETIYVKPGVVHCLSRMDKWNEPISEEHFPLPSSGNSGFPHRFVFGEEMCSMIRARKPNTVLRTFLVSRRWLYLGIHAFYGLNTFAFSSLGEFGRFFNGIGEARAERVAHIELLWHGSIMPRHETRTNQRTLPLIWLTRMKRLITVTIFIEEFAERRIRRKYEFPKIKGKYDLSGRFKDWTDDDIYTTNAPQSLLKRTATQPNWRGNRSMRTTHGMDFLYQLRGMKWVRFYEVDNRRRCIRDWSFFDDINSVVTMPKDRIYTLESDLRNLTKSTGLLYYQPSDEDQDLVSRFYAPDALPSIFSGSETSISDRSSPNNSQSRSTNSDMTSMDTDDDSNDGDNDKDRPPYIHFPDEWSDFSDDLEQSPGPDMDDDVPCDSIEDEDEGNDANDSGVDLMQDDDNDTATEGGIGGDLPDDSDRSYKTQATGQDKATQQGASHNNDDNDDGAVSEVLVPSYGAERGLPIMSDKLGFPTPSTQLIFTNSEASVSTTASTAPTCSHDNGDDEDDNATVSTGLFVRGTTPAPTVFSQRSPSANPSNRSYISPPPVPSQSPSAPHGNFVDLTVDSDQEMENNRTVSDDQDTESLFASSITAVSTINGPESTSSEENCRRALIIDLTQDSDNDSKVEAKFQPAGEDDEPVHVDVIEDIKTDLDGDTESLKRKFEHDDEDHEGDRNQKRARTFPLEADDGSTTSII